MTELESGADGASPPPARGVTRVQIEKARFNVQDYIWPGALGLLKPVGELLGA